MITPNDILEAIAAKIREKFPGEELYLEYIPQKFQRPSNLVVLESCAGDVGWGTAAVELRPVYSITTFVPVDEYHHSHLAALHLRQMVLTGLFLPGYLRVGDRAPKVQQLNLEGNYDSDSLRVRFQLTLSRGDFEALEGQAAELMQKIHFREEIDHGKSGDA